MENALAPRKLLVINQYYAPDVASTGQLAAEICSGLAQHGFEVHVITGQPSYTTSSPEAPEYEVLNGVHVHRIGLGKKRGRERLLRRLYGYVRFMWGARRLAKTLIKTGHPYQVMTFHNPPFVGLIGASLANRHGLRFIYVLYDIHPDILQATNWLPLPRPFFWLWDALNRRILRQADAVIVLGEGMESTLVSNKAVPRQKVHVIPMWGHPELHPGPQNQSIRRELGVPDDDLLLLYAGNMGIMHPVELILDAADSLRGLPVHFLFLGDGAKRQSLIARVEKERLTQVRFLPFQPEGRFIEILEASDASFVALRPGLERLAVPSRAYTFLSAARPLITIMAPEADIARLVTEDECGWNVTSASELGHLIEQLVQSRQELVRRGQNGGAVYEKKFLRDRVIEKYIKLLMNPA